LHRGHKVHGKHGSLWTIRASACLSPASERTPQGINKASDWDSKMTRDDTPFWKRKSLEEMTDSEWESVCDGCGRCCLVKLEDADDASRTYFTDVGCRLLDGETCRCKDYPNRSKKVKDCVRLTPRNVKRIVWLPPTCGYRLLADGRDLYWWHPLVSGDPDTVHQAGVSVRGKVGACEDDVPDDDLEDRIVTWPQRLPKGARRKG
jgi:uncharacterized protein